MWRKLFAFVGVMLLINACKPESKKEEEEVLPTPVVTVEAGSLSLGPIEDFIELPSTLETESLLTVVAEVGGPLEALAVDEDDRVSAGQVLAKIDFRSRELNVKKAKFDYDDAKRTLGRQEKLAAKKLNSADELDQARISFDRAGFELDRARLDLDRAAVTAPFEGVVAERFVRKGQYVSVGEQLFTLVDPNQPRAYVYVPEKDLGRVRRGQAVVFSFDALPGKTYRGEVDTISPLIDKSTGTFKVRVQLTEVGEPLLIGLFARVRIITKTLEEALLVPKNALVYDGGTPHVFLVATDDNGKTTAQRVPLKLGLETPTHGQVLEGAGLEDRIVVKGQNSLKNNQEVKVVGPPADAGEG